MRQYRIITDATADLEQCDVEKWDLTVIPMEVRMEDKTWLFDPQQKELKIDDFYAMIREGKLASTTQINAAVYSEYFEQALSNGEDVLYICFSSGLSGTLQSAMLAARELEEKYPQGRVVCLDSLAASCGLGFLTIMAAKHKAQGLSLEETTAKLEEERHHISHWFTVKDLQYLRRGGRISAAAAAFGTMLAIKPIMHVDNEGHLIPMEKAKGMKKALRAIVDHSMENYCPEVEPMLAIVHSDAPDEAEQLAQMLREKTGRQEICIRKLGPVITAHTGVGTLAVFAYGKQK